MLTCPASISRPADNEHAGAAQASHPRVRRGIRSGVAEALWSGAKQGRDSRATKMCLQVNVQMVNAASMPRLSPERSRLISSLRSTPTEYTVKPFAKRRNPSGSPLNGTLRNLSTSHATTAARLRASKLANRVTILSTAGRSILENSLGGNCFSAASSSRFSFRYFAFRFRA